MKDNNQKIRKAVAKLLGKKRLPSNIILDHIIPRVDGGSDHPVNLQLLPKRTHLLKTAYENAIRARINKKRK